MTHSEKADSDYWPRDYAVTGQRPAWETVRGAIQRSRWNRVPGHVSRLTLVVEPAVTARKSGLNLAIGLGAAAIGFLIGRVFNSGG